MVAGPLQPFHLCQGPATVPQVCPIDMTRSGRRMDEGWVGEVSTPEVFCCSCPRITSGPFRFTGVGLLPRLLNSLPDSTCCPQPRTWPYPAVHPQGSCTAPAGKRRQGTVYLCGAWKDMPPAPVRRTPETSAPSCSSRLPTLLLWSPIFLAMSFPVLAFPCQDQLTR